MYVARVRISFRRSARTCPVYFTKIRLFAPACFMHGNPLIFHIPFKPVSHDTALVVLRAAPAVLVRRRTGQVENEILFLYLLPFTPCRALRYLLLLLLKIKRAHAPNLQIKTRLPVKIGGLFF